MAAEPARVPEALPRVNAELLVEIEDVRIRKGKARLVMTVPVVTPEDVLALSAAAEDGPQHLVLVSQNPRLPIPGTESPAQLRMASRVAAGLRLLDALIGDAREQTDHTTGQIRAEGPVPPPFPPGTSLGTSPDEVADRVTELAGLEPERAAAAAARALRRGTATRRKRGG
jgi:hypothetical protein